MLNEKALRAFHQAIENWTKTNVPNVTDEEARKAGENFVGFLQVLHNIYERHPDLLDPNKSDRLPEK